MPKHSHMVIVTSFIGKSDQGMDAARDLAVAELNSWYAEQQILFAPDGTSVFQFSTAAYLEQGRGVFIITVFDARHDRERVI